jgi:hypothetical protein
MRVRPATRAGPGARELDPEGEAPALERGNSIPNAKRWPLSPRVVPCASSGGRLPAPSIIREEPRQCHGFPSQAALLIAGFPESSATLRKDVDASRLADGPPLKGAGGNRLPRKALLGKNRGSRVSRLWGRFASRTSYGLKNV